MAKASKVTAPKSPDRKSRLQEFVDWAAAHITGDEKGQAQIFLDRLFQAFGQKGLLEVGGTAEFRIRKAKEDGGGTAFGILQSSAHWQWFIAKCSKLKSDFRYTATSVFDTLPWPQSPSAKDVETVAEAGREVRRIRGEALARIRGGLRAVYRTLELPGRNPLKDAHAALDAAVLAAYGFSAKKDLLQQLLDLNLEVAARIERGEPVTAPGIPPDFQNPMSLITDDCIRPAETL
jgi:hypothetical protein